ncbi:MAG: DNA methyltransferase [Sulfurihydrogenibium azorense]|uniref:DNA methyltransferase n=1 Tax=Sulfurihydrogenibium azorense TaxID=309806 RepID=UPI00391DDECF
MINYKEKFWEVMERLYAGAEPEGKSGYVNLVKQKHRYFKEYVKPELEKEIEKRIGKFPDFREELYHKLYTFFDPYFSDSGSMFFVKSYIYYKQYERVYGEEDVKLFWKTKDLYYIKSDILIKSMEVKTEDGMTFFFDASNVEHKKNNEKKKLIYSFSHIDPQNRIVLKVEYSEKGKETKKEEIIKHIKKALGIKNFKEETLDKAIQTFERQLKVDYFIHKNPEAFLKQQFNLWISQYFISHEDVDLDPNRINQLIALKDIAYKIIEVISKFEEEIKRLWEKPRLVFNSNYVITLDRIAKKEKGIEIIKNLLEHPNIESQIKEWKELGIVGEDFDKKEILNNGILNQKWQFLPIDTKYFKDLEDEIISLFDLDEELDGLLIKSENFQALNTILPRFREKIQTIYIDPPFNTGKDFDYIDNFKDSSWLSLMKDRIDVGVKLLKKNGAFWLHLDDNANTFAKELLKEHFSQITEIIFNTNATKDIEADLFGYKSFGDNFQLKHQTLFYCRNENYLFRKLWKPNRNETNLNIGWLDLISFPKVSSPKKISDFVFKIEKWIDGTFKMQEINVEEKVFPIGDIWNDIFSFTQSEMRVSESFSFNLSQKPENLLRRIIQSSSEPKSIILDYFLGIATTTAVAHKLNRKWIGIEMGAHFEEFYYSDNVKKIGAKGRMKLVLAGDKNIKLDKKERRPHLSKDIDWNGGGFFKYYELEQFEEILGNVEYSQEPASEFFKKYAESSKITFSQVDPFIFDKRLAKAVKINQETNDWEVDFKQLYPDKQVDLIESIVNVLGIDYKTAKNLSKEDLLKFYRRVLLCL